MCNWGEANRGKIVASAHCVHCCEDLTMLQRYAIFDRWSAALERACEEVEANLEDWRQNHQYLHYVAAERACPTIRSRALAAFRASCIVAPRPGLPRPFESLTRDAASLVSAFSSSASRSRKMKVRVTPLALQYDFRNDLRVSLRFAI